MDDSIITRMQRRIKDLESAGIKTQYSKNSSNWHDSCDTDDMYIRISSNGGTTWGNAVAIRGKGTKGEPGEGIAAGGDKGELLVKHSGDDYDTEWRSIDTSDVPDSADRRYVTDQQRAVLSNTSNTNTGDETGASIKSKLGITILSGSNTGDRTLEELGGIPLSQKGNPGGVAELDTNGRVPQAQLPSYVDDVLEYNSLAEFPVQGESGKIYVADDTNLAYRWSGTAYVVISPTLALGETASTAYRGDRGKISYDHSQLISGNPHNVNKTDVGLWNVENVKQVPETRCINGHKLTEDITLMASDIGMDDIDTLRANSAAIVSLLSNNAGIESLETGTVAANFAALNKGTLGDAQIQSLKANKIDAGTIDTSTVTVAGPGGNMRLAGNRMQVFTGTGDSRFERVSIGDVNGDGSEYGIIVRGSGGKTVLFNEDGLTNEGMTDGWNTVEGGSLDSAPLDIESVITAVNGSVTTINSSKIQMDNGTLDVVLSNMQQSVNSQFLSQSADIQVNAIGISECVSQTTYDDEKSVLSSRVSKLEDTADAIKASFINLDGGTNILLNSSGLNDLSFWAVTGAVTADEDNSNSIRAGRYFNLYANSGLSQDVFAAYGNNYASLALKVKVKKASGLRGYINITDGSATYAVMDDSANSFDWSVFSLLFTPKNDHIAVNIGSSGDGLFVADLMLTQSSQPQDWSPAPAEMYTENVKVDSGGITVSNSGSETETHISNSQFAVIHQNKSVVSVNKDMTALQAVKVNNSLQIGNLLFSQSQSGPYINVAYLS